MIAYELNSTHRDNPFEFPGNFGSLIPCIDPNLDVKFRHLPTHGVDTVNCGLTDKRN
jgi:hypothetical protein